MASLTGRGQARLVTNFVSCDNANVAVAWTGIMRRIIINGAARGVPPARREVWAARRPLVGSAG
jgi:hypothetical protein